MTRKIKNLLIHYVREYALRILAMDNKINIINQFNFDKATESAVKALLKTNELTDKEKEKIETPEMYDEIKQFFSEKLLINYFMFAKKINYYEAKTLLVDKGTDFFEETKGIKSELYRGRFPNDYKATEKQINYLKSFNIKLHHEEELSGREASLMISCLNNPKKTKPKYYTYYIN